MDDKQLIEVLRDEAVPPPDENARKAAVNLAMAAFDQAQQEKKTRPQGSGILRRLMGHNGTQRGGWSMRKSQLLGGTATALVLVAVSAVTLQVYLKDYLTTQRASPATVQAVPDAKEQNEDFGLRRDQAATTDRLSGAVGQTKADDSAQANPAGPKSVRAAKPAAPPAPTSEAEQGRAQSGTTSRLLGDSSNFQVGGGASGSLAEYKSLRKREAAQAPHYQVVGRDRFEEFEENPVKQVTVDPVSTFSVDVDTAAYAFMRRQLTSGVLPQKDAVRVEELINYFDYAYPLPESRAQPFAPSVTVLPSPWKAGNKLIHIGIKGYDIAPAEKPRSNLVFLLDVSGSMNAPDKLPLLVNSMKLLLDGLGAEDTVAIVVYAGAAGTVLEPTKVAEKHKILAALERLSAGGSTAGAEGVRQAYALAEGNFDKEAVNRVILATDGDFNVGITKQEELKDFIERKRKTGVYLSVLGFGQGNLNDQLMQTLAQNGNGVAAHIDTLNEARKVLVEEAASTLFPIAQDVKIQIEFNPRAVAEYRLIGYETRALKQEDFNNDKVDAGDIGAGHTVTAIYEITPLGSENRLIEPSRYQGTSERGDQTDLSDEYAFLKIRYKLPGEAQSTLITAPITRAQEAALEGADARSREARWATAVAGFGQVLAGGRYTGSFGHDDVIALAQSAKGEDRFGYRAEFINLVRLARSASALPKN